MRESLSSKARSLKIYLSQKYTGEKLRTIGEYFGIGDSAVSHACKRFMLRVQRDGGLKKRLARIEKKLAL
jgi:chromosomal replication initiation ATPase DnaA